MFRLFRKEQDKWSEVGQLELSGSSSYIEKAHSVNSTTIVISHEYFLEGSIDDLKRLKNHIDVVLGDNK
jgi:hypothetical protein